MTIPEHVDFGTFYKTAKAKGISVVSRYKGVYIFHTKTRLNFMACVRHTTIGYFPFTKQGEYAAHQMYLRAIGETETKMKGTYKKAA